MPAFYFERYPASAQQHCPARLLMPDKTLFIQVTIRNRKLAKNIIALNCHNDDARTNIYLFSDMPEAQDETASVKEMRLRSGLTERNLRSVLTHGEECVLEPHPAYKNIAQIIVRHYTTMSPDIGPLIHSD